MNYTFELNNAKQTQNMATTKSVIEVFSAMVNGTEMPKYLGKKADEAVEKIKTLGERAAQNDYMAINELNSLRTYIVRPQINETMKVLSLFGNYKELGLNETAEIDIFSHEGVEANRQAARTDVTFPIVYKQKQPVAMQTISGGYAVDYRQIALGDMELENEGVNQVKTMIRNNAIQYIITQIFNAVENATGVKYFSEEAGLTKTNTDAVLRKIRRFGKANVIGTYGLLSQFTPWAGYTGTINGVNFAGISERTMNELTDNGILGAYNGSILTEIPEGIDFYNKNKAGDDFGSLYPAGLGIILPSGQQSGVNTFRKGDIASFTGNDVTTGQVLTRFDLEVGAAVAKGREHTVGIIHDTTLDTL